MNSNGWKKIRLEEGLDALIDYRGKTPKKTTFGVPLITAKIVKDGFIQEPVEFIAESNYSSWMVRGFPKVGDVVLTVEAPLGEVAQLKESKVALAQRIVTLRGKEGVLDNGFLKYFLQSEIGQARLKERETGTTVTGIKQSELRQIEIDTPPFETQQKIASILSSIEDKIELNRQTNQTLEAIAQAIFKEWFVDFNFPDATGEIFNGIPSGWKKNSINEIASNIQYGYTQSSSQEKVGPKFLRITDIQGGQVNWDSVPYCLVNDKDYGRYRIQEHDIFIARTGASTGENIYVINPPEAVFASYLIRVQFQSYATANYVGRYLRRKEYFDYITSILSGSAQPNANAQQLTASEILIPDSDLLEKYFKIVYPLDQLKACLNEQNQTLAQLRDRLLPKLMKGEIQLYQN